MATSRALAFWIVCCSILGDSGSITAQDPLPMSGPLYAPADPTAPQTDFSLPDPASLPHDLPTADMGVRFGPSPFSRDCWSWRMLPDGLLFPAYLASGRESRIASHWIHEEDQGGFWDVTLGGRVGVLRYGNRDPVWPEGWQFDIEGAAFPRLTLDQNRDMVSTDFRFGIPLTYRRGPLEAKLAYYHLSSHMGDEIMVRRRSFHRVNYTRDALVTAVAYRPHPDLRLYAEAGWAYYMGGGSKPWEFQFGIDYSPIDSTYCCVPAPFFALNSRIREEVNFGGNLTVQTGLQWRGETGRLFRFGLHYFNGKTDQYEFFTEDEEQFGVGLWYDY
jgi:hypothetical protein